MDRGLSGAALEHAPGARSRWRRILAVCSLVRYRFFLYAGLLPYLLGAAWAFAVAGALCAAAIGAYCMTRLIAFPQLADDVGNWGETAGVVSVASEAAVVALSLVFARAHTNRRRSYIL